MSPDNQMQQMGLILEQFEKLKARLDELIVAGVDTSTTDPKANPHVVDKCENNLDLIIKRAEELKEQSLKVLQRELEPTFREKYAEAVRDMNAALSVAVEKNQIVLNIFNAAQRLFGESQNVVHSLTWKELLINPRAESELQAWRSYVKQKGYIPLD